MQSRHSIAEMLCTYIYETLLNHNTMAKGIEHTVPQFKATLKITSNGITIDVHLSIYCFVYPTERKASLRLPMLVNNNPKFR